MLQATPRHLHDRGEFLACISGSTRPVVAVKLRLARTGAPDGRALCLSRMCCCSEVRLYKRYDFIKILSTYDVIPLDSCGSLLLPLARLTRRRGILG